MRLELLLLPRRRRRRRRPRQQRQQQLLHCYRRHLRLRPLLSPPRLPLQRLGKQTLKLAEKTTPSLSNPSLPPCRLRHSPLRHRLRAPHSSPKPRAQRPPALRAQEGTNPLFLRPRAAAWPAEEGETTRR